MSATPAKLADAEPTEVLDARAGKDAPLGGVAVTGDALTGYLRAVIEWQGVQLQAMQAQLDALQALALQRAQQVQQALGANVARLAKESGAAEGSRLALDGTWMPPAAPAQ